MVGGYMGRGGIWKRFALQSLTLGQILDAALEKYPDNDAVVYVDRDYRLTYRQFGELVDKLAGA